MPRYSRFLLVVLCLGLSSALLIASVHAESTAAGINYDRDIRPLLSDRCFVCHGPDAENRQADLRLDLRESAASVISKGDPATSALYQRITSKDPDEQMPPPDSNLSLNEEERERVRAWIEQGAPWQQHWAFTAPQKVTPPEVAGDDWSRNAIDRFIAKRHAEQGLAPAPPASRSVLIRRMSFDLTGLPPTLEEVDAFVNDESADAMEEAVERLLKSPRYGERMAAFWLDVARYSDTYGYQVDRDRFVWPWRDWVVRAFNENLPYDQFLTEQLAGDLLPDATDDQILATTFNRLHPQKVEGGSTPEEFRIEYVADRTQTFATAFLGLTMECCRCHDHKYDPLSQREYYQLTAYFDKIDEAGLYSYFTPSVPTPTLTLMDDAKKKQRADLQAKVKRAEKSLAEAAAGAEPAFQGWLASVRSRLEKGLPPRESVEPSFQTLPGQIAHLDFEAVKATGGNQIVAGRFGKAVRLSGDDVVGVGVGNFVRSQPFSVTLWMNTPDVKSRAVVFHRSRAWTDAGSRGYQLLIEDGKLSASLIHFWPGNAIRVRTVDPVATQQWTHVGVTYDGSRRAAGLRIYVNGRLADVEIIRDRLTKNITGGGGNHIGIGERFRDRGFTQGMVDEFRVFDRELTSLEVRHLTDGSPLISKNSLDELSALRSFYLTRHDPAYTDRRNQLRQARQQLDALLNGAQEIMVMRAMDRARSTYLLKRGAYDARGEEVHAAPPQILAEIAPLHEPPADRLGLAQWMTDPKHPLTARVAVNRIWQWVMGQGLVRTPEDFGRQGELPTHPELLDWLARDFVEHGWDTKRLVKQIVMSAAYQQSSATDPKFFAKDPENRWWARASAFRLPAEMLRDNALAISGLLVERVGGPPARPYELEASFKPSKRDKGEGLYRRSLYTYWKRTGPAPMMMVLDSAKRDVCRVKRERTSTPLQSFVMMNSPQFVEAARVLAERLIRDAGENARDSNELLAKLFRTTTGRRPAADELAVLQRLLDRQRDFFQKHPDNAEKYLQVGDKPRDKRLDAARVAALTAVANAMMNHDEAVMRR